MKVTKLTGSTQKRPLNNCELQYLCKSLKVEYSFMQMMAKFNMVAPDTTMMKKIIEDYFNLDIQDGITMMPGFVEFCGERGYRWVTHQR